MVLRGIYLTKSVFQVKCLEFIPFLKIKENRIFGQNSVVEMIENLDNSRTTRIITNGKLVELGKSKITRGTFINDASRVWNRMLQYIRICEK